jgi:hypothetical protein
MQIANPIYDIVFKYLLEDSKIARLILSTIIGEEIVNLTLRPQEQTVELKERNLTVFRVDFSAVIKTETGQKLVLIEIQKAKFAGDIMRFRRYLGEQYRNRSNSYVDEINGKERATPIISIYFLGYPLEYAHAPLIKVNRQYIDITTGQEIKDREPFIESLTHDSFVIQIPRLRAKRQSELEQLLGIFDQSAALSNQHILNIKEEDFPEKYHPVIRRLQKAFGEESVRDIMDAEDDYLEGLQDLERELANRDKLIAEKEDLIAEKEDLIAEKDKSLAEKDKSLAEKDKSLAEKDLLIKALQEELQRTN